MTIRRSLIAGLGVALLAPLAAPAAAAPAPDQGVVRATQWLGSQQQADGGFELAGFPGFETSDAVFALAGTTQTGTAWDASQALAAVEAYSVGGLDALDAIDDLVDGETDPDSDAAGARAAKVISLVVLPLGLDPTDFDPSNDSAEPVDLLARMNVHLQLDGSYDLGALFNGVLFTAIALDGAGGEVPGGLVDQIVDAQRTDGSWDYTGTPDEGPGDDIDTTALALLALTSAGLDRSEPAVVDAIAFLTDRQQANGSWLSFGASDPNSTALAAIALSAAMVDVTLAPYANPYAWLRSQQLSSGRIASPNDGFGVNTIPTTQTIQALSRQWYLTAERSTLLSKWSLDLASPANDEAFGRGEQVGSDVMGPNSSVRFGRLLGARAVLGSQPGREAAAADLFQAAFGRGLDPSGRAFWSNQLIALSRPEVLARLTGSSEYYRRAGGTIPTFVDAVYQSVLGRGPDPSGRAFWIARLEGGASVQSVARSLTASNEYRRLQVQAAYQRTLDRQPTVGERDLWTARTQTERIEVLLATLASSAEYYENGLA